MYIICIYIYICIHLFMHMQGARDRDLDGFPWVYCWEVMKSWGGSWEPGEYENFVCWMILHIDVHLSVIMNCRKAEKLLGWFALVWIQAVKIHWNSSFQWFFCYYIIVATATVISGIVLADHFPSRHFITIQEMHAKSLLQQSDTCGANW